MTVDTSQPAPPPRVAAAWWNNAAVRGVVYQLAVLVGVAGLGWYLVSNTLDNLATRGIVSGFGFLGREAGFGIGESAIAYSAADTYARAIAVGLLNTLIVSLLGIVFATLLGTVVGIARLSANWLVARLAAVYVEGVRNIPVLLQLFLWYSLITEALPGPRQALNPAPGFFLSNRGFKYPVPVWETAHWIVLAAFLAGCAAAFFVYRWARRRQDLTGQPFPAIRTGGAVIVGLPVLAFLAAGAPTAMSVPELKGFNFVGGGSVSPEFAALWFGLTVYTASFIAEIVRSGILAVSHGQTEAALALGLSRGQVLRLVVLPQAMRVIIPPLTSQYLNLTKNSSLAVAIGYPDLVSVANTTINQTGQAIEGIAVIMAVYLAVSLSIAAFMNWYNKKMALVTR
jgi:general L-amino acid transport system permease protein